MSLLDLVINEESKNQRYSNSFSVGFIGRFDSPKGTHLVIEVAKKMNDSAILVMASNFEGLPRVLIESGLCKLPSLATNINGISTPFNSKGGTMLYEIQGVEEELAREAFRLAGAKLPISTSFVKRQAA